jgi:hypothetical protein
MSDSTPGYALKHELGVRWVDWMTAQLCGFFCRGGAALETPDEADATALPDERRCIASDRVCFFASTPHVCLAGRPLTPGDVLAFDVWGALPAGCRRVTAARSPASTTI